MEMARKKLSEQIPPVKSSTSAEPLTKEKIRYAEDYHEAVNIGRVFEFEDVRSAVKGLLNEMEEFSVAGSMINKEYVIKLIKKWLGAVLE